jgi:hypothetical protein
MMKKIIFICALMFSFITQAQSTVKKNLGDYSILKVYNGIEVELIKSTESKLEITGEKSEMVKIKNVNNTLKLSLPFSLKPSNNSAEGKVLIKLFYKNNINIIDANEGSTITGKNFKQDKIEIKSQERAYINLVIEAKNIIVRSSSGGIIKLSGIASNQDVDVDLYGVYHGFGLKVENSSMIKAGTGAKAEVLAGKTLNAKVSFGGSIFYKGNPELIRDKKVAGGIIQKKD